MAWSTPSSYRQLAAQQRTTARDARTPTPAAVPEPTRRPSSSLFGNSGGYRPMPMPFRTMVGGVAGGGAPPGGMNEPMPRSPGAFSNVTPGVTSGGMGGMGGGLQQDPAILAQQHQQKMDEMRMKLQVEQMKQATMNTKNQGVQMQTMAKIAPGLLANGGQIPGGISGMLNNGQQPNVPGAPGYQQPGLNWASIQNQYRNMQPSALRNWNDMGNAWRAGAGNSFRMQNPFNAAYQQSLGMKPQTSPFTRSPGTPEGSLSRNTGGVLNF